MGLSENSVPHCTRWFSWSLSLLNGYFIGNIPHFQTYPYRNIWIIDYIYIYRNPQHIWFYRWCKLIPPSPFQPVARPGLCSASALDSKVIPRRWQARCSWVSSRRAVEVFSWAGNIWAGHWTLSWFVKSTIYTIWLWLLHSYIAMENHHF